ncbi:GntR family transcriptional regulator [Paenarthrobacter sp. RAF54_2]|uniref:GntR family transcriptional regulator n=1 Tax=Paenarthrobacter sp. RAF54_2 TaxID=3233061 RepID=UPI003F9D67F7
MRQDSFHFLTQLAAQSGPPLRVSLFSRIAEAIRNGLLKSGSKFPSESQLGADLKASRNMIREDLFLHKEDGIFGVGGSVGRSVAETQPCVGLERIRPFEEILCSPGQHLEVKRIRLLRTSGFAALEAGDEPSTEWRIWESLLIRDGETIAHLQETVSTQHLNPGGRAATTPNFEDDPGVTLFGSLKTQLSPLSGPAECQIGLRQVGTDHADHLDLRPSDPVLVLTQQIRHDHLPCYVATCLITARAGLLSVVQSFQS